MKDYKIFVINPGSTSTKVAMFKGKEKIYSENIQHDVSELKAFKEVRDQLDYRRDMILESVKKSGETLTDVDAFPVGVGAAERRKAASLPSMKRSLIM